MIVTVRRTWLRVLDPLYALALVGLVYHAMRPEVSGPMLDDRREPAGGGVPRRRAPWRASGRWRGSGRFSSPWPSGISSSACPATPWAAAVPLAAVFATGRSIHRWLHAFPGFTGMRRQAFRTLAFLYQLLALVMLVDALVVLVPHRRRRRSSCCSARWSWRSMRGGPEPLACAAASS